MHEAPRRLVDDPAASSSLRDDLARAGEEHHAYAASYDTASKAAAFQAALASQGGAVAGLGLLTKIVLGVAAAAAFMIAGALLHARLSAGSAPLESGAANTPGVPPVLPAPPATPPATQAPQGSAAPVAAALRAPTPGTRRAARDDAQQEVRQLARIRAFLQSGAAASALELSERGQRELGESALWQEREALSVLALLALGRMEQAAQRSVSLFARFPDSPFRAEIERRLREPHED